MAQNGPKLSKNGPNKLKFAPDVFLLFSLHSASWSTFGRKMNDKFMDLKIGENRIFGQFFSKDKNFGSIAIDTQNMKLLVCTE